MVDLFEIVEADREGHRVANLAQCHGKGLVGHGKGPGVVLTTPEKGLLPGANFQISRDHVDGQTGEILLVLCTFLLLQQSPAVDRWRIWSPVGPHRKRPAIGQGTAELQLEWQSCGRFYRQF